MIDLAGVGIGPSNLSLAALLRRLPETVAQFFDRQHEFRWHEGLLFDRADIHVSMLKDLVTPVDPTSPYSFLSFLSAHKRLYRFLHAEYPRVSRREFEQYLRWVASQIEGLNFNEDVISIDWQNGAFTLQTSRRACCARHLALGSGWEPAVPECALRHLGNQVFHGRDFRFRKVEKKGTVIAVIGGGQTGAEVFFELISDSEQLPRCVYWITRRHNFLPLDESPFTNDLFTPSYANHFFQQTRDTRELLLNQQVLASYGISEPLLRTIYRRLYELEYVEGNRCFKLLASSELTNLSTEGRVTLTLCNGLTGAHKSLLADSVVLCTGFAQRIPKYLEPMLSRIHINNGRFVVKSDFTIGWDGPTTSKLYVQNAARDAYGIADPNLSLIAWRSATIVNSLAGRQVYDADSDTTAIDWS